MLSHLRMLRESATITERAVDLRGVTDPSVDPRLPGGRELVALTDATVTRDLNRIGVAALAVVDVLGEAALVDAAGVIGNFKMMNRIAGATGIPVGRVARQENATLIDELGLEGYGHLD